MSKSTNKIKRIKALVLVLELLLLAFIVYLLFLPAYPQLKHVFRDKEGVSASQNIEEIKKVVDKVVAKEVKKEAKKSSNHLPDVSYEVSEDRLIIPKIGVNTPIIVSNNEQEALNKGAWLMPVGVNPDEAGNTVITGHRFKYLPPNNLTFYLFHELEVNDLFSIIWKNEKYYYRIKDIRVVDDSDAWPHRETDEKLITMYTCTPIYSTEKRLVVTAEPVE